MDKFSLGLSTCFSGDAGRGTFEDFAAAGVKCVELSSSYERYRDDFRFLADPGAAAESAAAAGIELWSMHLPFSQDYDVSHPDDGRRAFSIAIDRECINAAAKMGCKVAVIHPSSEPIDDADRHTRLVRSYDALLRLAEHCDKLGLRLAVEDLPRTCLGRCSEEILALLDGNEALSVCFDTNHLLGEDNVAFIRAVAGRIITLHVSDYDFIDERHQLPFEGKNDWSAIIGALREVGYAGPWMYEVGRKPSAGRRSGPVLTPSDMAENHRRLMAL